MSIPIIVSLSKWPPKQDQYYSTVVLSIDDWNDYGYRTLFHGFYCDDAGMVSEIGDIKIYFYDRDEARTTKYYSHTSDVLEKHIDHLSDKFCSLGQDLSFYINLKNFLPNEYHSILTRLNDIATIKRLNKKYINEKGVQTSLLRFSGAEKALNEAINILNEINIPAKDISFSYVCMLPYCELPIKLNFNFSVHQHLPYRINILVGKNGTGKTQILTKLAQSLSGFTDKQNDTASKFINKRPSIDKVMSISYSAFDSFKKPPLTKSEGPTDSVINKRMIYSYVYCGIQSEKGTLSLPELKRNFNEALKKVRYRDRYITWKSILSEIIESEDYEIIHRIDSGDTDINWSSGQHILISTITELVANIENESIILFDEPEIHLHPNAIANTMRMFYRLLDKFNSYAIFSTHSPIIIQEIPSQYIQVLDRVDNLLTVRNPEIECFGENITNIIRDVFDVTSSESNYKSVLKEMSKHLTYNEIISSFDKGLSLNALIYLKNCCFGGVEEQ